MTDKPRRASIGFDGGQALGLRVTQTQLETLKQTVTSGERGWTELETVDGAISFDAAKVSFLRVESDDHRVGF